MQNLQLSIKWNNTKMQELLFFHVHSVDSTERSFLCHPLVFVKIYFVYRPRICNWWIVFIPSPSQILDLFHFKIRLNDTYAGFLSEIRYFTIWCPTTYQLPRGWHATDNKNNILIFLAITVHTRLEPYLPPTIDYRVENVLAILWGWWRPISAPTSSSYDSPANNI